MGHLRNAALGDTLVRLLRFQGVPVETQNYIDDTGAQVADVVVGFREIEGKTLADVRTLADSSHFDYHCWDLYAQVTEWYEADATRLDARSKTLRDLEHGGNDAAEMARFITDRIVRRHLATMQRLNVEYDLLSWEGDILRLDFWTTAFDLLKAAGAVFLESAGKQAGCWVMPITDGSTADGSADEDAGSAEASTDNESHTKVIVRSDGTVTYVGKDIAYQFWKFGVLGKDFGFQSLRDPAFRPATVGHEQRDHSASGGRYPATAGLRSGQRRVQRDRHTPVVSPAAPETGTGGHSTPRQGGTFRALLVRDGGPITQYRSGPRLCGRRPRLGGRLSRSPGERGWG